MMLKLVASLFVLILAGCASTTSAPVVDSRGGGAPAKAAASGEKFYTVKKGDTLKNVALAHGVDYRDLAAWNNIENINSIKIGQQLRVAPTVAMVGAPASEGTEVRPIALGGPVVARSLDAAPAAPSSTAGPAAAVPSNAAAPAAAVPPAPAFSANSEMLKRAPKGGKLPYSEENLARLKAQAAAPAPVALAPATLTVTASAPPEKPLAEKPATPVSPAPAAGDIEWAWPSTGKLLGSFSEGATGGQEVSKGIDIAGKIGDPVEAAAAGKVIYVGVFPKHGNLVVLLHGGAFSSVYAHNSRILVKEGQAVKRGEKIAELGNSDADQPKLHFELRQQGKPVDPLKFLPPR
jgi:lipoprotein NlpD